jgi:ubiquinone/menaquinone biosynthesis C-methylase UbiE
MDSLKKRLKHCRKPKGKLGMQVLNEMNEHHSELIKWGLNHIKVEHHYLILDIGCGGGYTISNLASKIVNGKVFGIDYSKLSVKYSQKYCKNHIDDGRVKIEEASVSNLPFPNNKFDLITAVETFYFWPDKTNDLKEILRVLRPGGRLVLINEMYVDDNQEIEEKKKNWAEAGDFEVYTVEETKNFLLNAGYNNFKIFEEKNNGWITIIAKKPNKIKNKK